jgi:hypothetical protein
MNRLGMKLPVTISGNAPDQVYHDRRSGATIYLPASKVDAHDEGVVVAVAQSSTSVTEEAYWSGSESTGLSVQTCTLGVSGKPRNFLVYVPGVFR